MSGYRTAPSWKEHHLGGEVKLWKRFNLVLLPDCSSCCKLIWIRLKTWKVVTCKVKWHFQTRNCCGHSSESKKNRKGRSNVFAVDQIFTPVLLINEKKQISEEGIFQGLWRQEYLLKTRSFEELWMNLWISNIGWYCLFFREDELNSQAFQFVEQCEKEKKQVKKKQQQQQQQPNNCYNK